MTTTLDHTRRAQRGVARMMLGLGCCTLLLTATATTAAADPTTATTATATATTAATSVPPGSGVAPVGGGAADLVGSVCPPLFALGVQGTGQSASDASPTTDTGMLSSVFMPMLAKAGTELVERAYVPYAAGFGGAVPGANVPYAQSVSEAQSRLEEMTARVAAACPGTRFTVAGYSQGAHAVSMFARTVGAGTGVIPPDKLVGVATFGDPTRAPGAPLFPGAPQQTLPEPAPGTRGVEVAKLAAPQPATASGGGIGPVADTATDYGAVTGRVASFCAPGDLACDAPAGAPIARVVANIAGQSDLSGGDPIRSLSSVAEALALTTIKTAVPVINEDVQGSTLASLSLAPQKSLSQRLAEASDPRTPLPSASEAVAALVKLGTIGLNAAITVARDVVTPGNLAEFATVGLANPVAAAALLGTKLLDAVVKLVPPATTSRLTQQAFTALRDNITDNAELLNVATLVKYGDVIARHNSYGSTPTTATGESPVGFVADWFAALAKDLATTTPAAAATSGPPRPPATATPSPPVATAPTRPTLDGAR